MLWMRLYMLKFRLRREMRKPNFNHSKILNLNIEVEKYKDEIRRRKYEK